VKEELRKEILEAIEASDVMVLPPEHLHIVTIGKSNQHAVMRITTENLEHAYLTALSIEQCVDWHTNTRLFYKSIHIYYYDFDKLCKVSINITF